MVQDPDSGVESDDGEDGGQQEAERRLSSSRGVEGKGDVVEALVDVLPVETQELLIRARYSFPVFILILLKIDVRLAALAHLHHHSLSRSDLGRHLLRLTIHQIPFRHL